MLATPHLANPSHTQLPDGTEWHQVHLLDLASSTPTSSASRSSLGGQSSHRRRRSSASAVSQAGNFLGTTGSEPDGLSAQRGPRKLSTIPGTPDSPMSLSRSTSPTPGGGWASPGLNSPQGNLSGRSSPSIGLGETNTGTHSVTWESAKAKSDGVNGYPSFTTRNNGFFSRHYRRLSHSLPRFNASTETCYAEKEKLGRGRWLPKDGSKLTQFRRLAGRVSRKARLRILGVLAVIVMIVLFYTTPLHYYWRRAKHIGGGKKFVIILAANQGGGVMEWKGPREWAIERDSIRNKKKYANRWGYDLEIADISIKKRYAHEWRESWEKVDTIRNSLRKYPDAEWIWWLDLNTFIMEPSKSLQSHIFNNLARNTYRDINEYNPLNITHPFTHPYLGQEALSRVGDGKPSSINLIVPQDCSGFNLGSFFIRRSAWTDRLLDVWWDPVHYEQKHMEWEHKEQDALEFLYINQPWIRPHTAFLPQRSINSFPPGACSENGNDTRIHYNEKDRDFLVNMAGCEWGRDCWGEMYNYRELSNYLNRNPWERFKEDLVAVLWFKITGKKVRL